MLLLMFVGAASAASTLHLSTEIDTEIAVDGRAERVKPRKEVDVKAEPGTRRISVGAYQADLELPDEVHVWVRWDGVKLVLDDAKTNAQNRAGTAMKVGNTAMAVGAGVQQAQAVGSDLSAAKSDMDKAQRGELTESSRTEVEVNVGPGGVSSSSSRTTAGADGVQGHSRSTEIGPNGVRTEQGSASLDGSGYSEQSSATSVSFLKLESGLQVKLTPVGGGSAPTPVPVEAAAVAAGNSGPSEGTVGTPGAAAAPGLPEGTLWYKDVEASSGTTRATTQDTFLEAESGKLALFVHNDGDGYLALRGSRAVAGINGAEVKADGGKDKPPKIVGPKDKGRQVLNFEGGDLRAAAWELDTTGVVEAVPRTGANLDAGAFTLAGDTSFDAQGLRCEVSGLKKKTQKTNGKLDCTWSGEGYVLVDASRLAVNMGGQDWANGAKGKGVEVVASGQKVKVPFEWEVEAKVGDMQFDPMALTWGETFQVAQGTPVDLGRMRFELDAERTEEEN